MFSIKNLPNELRISFLSKRLSNVYIYLVVILCSILQLKSQSGFSCKTEPNNLIFSPAVCDVGSQKCVKIKFHFMNNSGGNLNQPNDILFRDLLNYFNDVFHSGNIHFSTASECIHVGTTDPSLVAVPTQSNPNSVYSHFFDSNGQPVNDPDFGYDNQAINI